MADPAAAGVSAVTRRNLPAICRLGVAVAALLCLMLAAEAAPPNARAQEDFSDRQPIDLAVDLAFIINSLDFQLRVANTSDIPVYDVKVRIDTGIQKVLVPTFDGASFVRGVLTVPSIRAHQTLRFKIDKDQSAPSTGFFPLRVSIVSSSPEETPGFQYNNRVETWAHAATGRLSLRQTGLTSMAVSASATDLRPSLNGRTTFKVAAKNVAGAREDHGHGSGQTLKEDTQLKITLTPGLSFASSSMPDTTVSGKIAIWRVGDLPGTSDATRTKTLDIPVILGGDSPLEARCLTAEVYHVIPPDPEDKRYDDVARVCLGDGPLEVFGAWPNPNADGGTRLLTSFLCIGVTTYPCNANDTLELVVEQLLPHPTLKQRRDDAATPLDSGSAGVMYLQPESVVIHVDDPRGRAIEDESVIWSTGEVMRVAESFARLSADWTYTRAVTVTAPGGGNAPGRWALANTNDFVLLEAEDSTKVVASPGTMSIFYQWISSTGIRDVKVNFSKMGTYKALYEMTVERSGTTYTDSATYTFHVGPLADLEVRDAGANPEVAGNRRAYTIEAVNHGPSNAGAVEVTVSGVPKGARVLASQGSYDPATGIWRIGDLEHTDWRPLIGKGDAETLTIIPKDGAPAPITATIESTEDYTVCIDSAAVDVAASSESACTGGGHSWHSAEYYDPIDGNNTATIAARLGTGRGHPDVPQSMRVDKFGSLALLRWQPVERLNGFDVTHYQVEKNGVLLADDVRGIIYADLQGGTVNQAYRVRAVNTLGVPGPWSRPSGASGPLEAEELGAPTGLTATPGSGVGRIDLSWFAPSEEPGLRYRIERATDGAGPWRTLVGSHSGTTYSQTGLSPGTTHYYRVAALQGSLVSPWAYVQATTEGLQVYAPGRPMNPRFTSVDRTAVTLAWDPPAADGGSPVTGYEYRVFGPCASGADAVCDVVAPTRVGATTTSRRISGLNREGTYEFSVRALNAVGAGDWSQSITKEVGPATAAGGRVVLSPSRLTVTEGGEATYRVKLSRAPAMPLWVTLHWDGDDSLGGELPFQQFKVLLPGGYDTSGLPEWCGGVRLDWSEAAAWNAGVPITVAAAEDDDSESESLTILHSLDTVPHDCLGMAEADWQRDPAYDGMHGIALQVTGRDND